jgi:spermidine/putrescine transport system ATP-binding protein
MGSGNVRLVDLVKKYDDVVAVDGIDLEITGGEFFSLLGPSGCGKTTTLRMIAGFEQPTAGRVVLNGVDVATTPPHRRSVNTVFQHYALFPHLSVYDNVAFGLRFKDVSKDEERRKVGDSLALVRMGGYEKRKPTQLSGGQQQRVALARALVLSPEVLLLDEPLGALDAKLRKALQIELKSLQEAVGITFIYVTHDQEEALTMSDRLAVMSAGRVEQLGTPQEVYEAPASAYVADFLGVSNLMEVEVVGRTPAGLLRVKLADAVELTANVGAEDLTGAAKMVIRPERVRLLEPGASGENHVAATVERLVYMGPTVQLIVELESGHRLLASFPNQGGGPAFDGGEAVLVHLPPEALRVLASS